MRFVVLLSVSLLCSGFLLVATGMESREDASAGVRERMENPRLRLIEWLENVDRDAFLPGEFVAEDEVILGDGTSIGGKVLDYGPYLCVIDDNKRWVMPRDNAEKINLGWGDSLLDKPEMPDLDVTYIERLPRYRSNHNNVIYDTEKGIHLAKPNDDPLWPPKGTKTTFKAHVVNKGSIDSKAFRYEWFIDGRRKKRGEHEAIEPGREVIVDYSWKWQNGPHTVTFKVIPDGDDFSVWNDSHTDRTDSLSFIYICSQDAYDGFNNNLNMVESFSYEDWVQYHFQLMNFLFKASIHPGSPSGCHEVCRIDKMITLPDEVYRDKYESEGRDEEGFMLYEGKWGFTPWDRYSWRAQNVDWGLIHEMGHQISIIDYYTIDMPRDRIFAIDRNGERIDVGHWFPHTGMMRGHGPVAYTEATAIALNWQRGKHRGFFGDHLFNLPRECGIRVLDFNGKPIIGAEIRVFRREWGKDDEGREMWIIPEEPVFEGETDDEGVYMLPNEEPPVVFTTEMGFTRGPSPFGDALVISDTGLLLLEIWKGDRRDVQFTNVTEFMVGCGRGYEGRYVDDIESILSGEDGSEGPFLKPPRIVDMVAEDPGDRVTMRWSNVGDNTAVAFRIYGMPDGLPFQRKNMTELATVNVNGPLALTFRPTGWVTMTGIDEEGNESVPACPVRGTRPPQR
jgi:hypothetical protein